MKVRCWVVHILWCPERTIQCAIWPVAVAIDMLTRAKGSVYSIIVGLGLEARCTELTVVVGYVFIETMYNTIFFQSHKP